MFHGRQTNKVFHHHLMINQVGTLFLFFQLFKNVPQNPPNRTVDALAWSNLRDSVSCTQEPSLFTWDVPALLEWLEAEGVIGMCVLVLCVCVWSTSPTLLPSGTQAGRWLHSGPPQVNIWPRETKFVCVCETENLPLRLVCMGEGSRMGGGNSGVLQKTAGQVARQRSDGTIWEEEDGWHLMYFYSADKIYTHG